MSVLFENTQHRKHKRTFEVASLFVKIAELIVFILILHNYLSLENYCFIKFAAHQQPFAISGRFYDS